MTIETDDHFNRYIALLHEGRNFLHLIKASIEQAEVSLGNKKGVADASPSRVHLDHAKEAATDFAQWLNFLEIEINPNLVANQRMERRSITDKFSKVARMFKRKINNSRIKFNTFSSQNILSDYLPIIDLLPYTIYDNCLKYTPTDGSIQTDISHDDDYTYFRVSNYGPKLDLDEFNRVFEDGYQGRNNSSVQGKFPGNGRGLFLANYIVGLHDGEISAGQGDGYEYELNGIVYSQFVIRGKLPKRV